MYNSNEPVELNELVYLKNNKFLEIKGNDIVIHELTQNEIKNIDRKNAFYYLKNILTVFNIIIDRVMSDFDKLNLNLLQQLSEHAIKILEFDYFMIGKYGFISLLQKVEFINEEILFNYKNTDKIFEYLSNVDFWYAYNNYIDYDYENKLNYIDDIYGSSKIFYGKAIIHLYSQIVPIHFQNQT